MSILGVRRRQAIVVASAVAVAVVLAGCGQIPVSMGAQQPERPGAASSRTPSARGDASAPATRPPTSQVPSSQPPSPQPPSTRPPSTQPLSPQPPPRGPSGTASGTAGGGSTGTVHGSAPPATTTGPLAHHGNGPGGSFTRIPGRAVALTFDDGPSATTTPQLLDLLARNDVKATFCIIGEHAQEHPDLVRRIVAAGHTLCNHTWDHDLALAHKSDQQIRADLERTNAAIRAAAPGAKISWFRAPGGNFDDRLVRIAASLGMSPLYWQVDTRDWDAQTHGTGQQMVQWITTLVRAQVRPGSIVLAHDIHPDTITAFTILLPELSKRFSLVALPPHGSW